MFNKNHKDYNFFKECFEDDSLNEQLFEMVCEGFSEDLANEILDYFNNNLKKEKIEKDIITFIEDLEKSFDGVKVHTYWASSYVIISLLAGKEKNDVLSQITITDKGVYNSNKHCSLYLERELLKKYNYFIEE